MQYKHCQSGNFEDFASGRVIFNKPGLTNFPVRLAQEIYCRCLGYSEIKNDLCIYDPCCGGGYLLTVLGILNTGTIKKIVASDINSDILEFTKQNLALSTKSGLEKRLQNLISLYNETQKKSHFEAIESTKTLMQNFNKHDEEYNITIFNSNVLNGHSLNTYNFKADIVLTDIPYGNLISWEGDSDNAVNTLLINIIPILKPSSIIAVCSDKKQKITCNKYKRLEKQQIGKRKFEILKLL